MTPDPHRDGPAIRPRTVWTIYAKEIRETFRDRKTLFLIVGIPLIFYPLLLLVATEVTLSQVDKIQKQTVQIAPDGDPLPERLFRLLDEDETIQVALTSDPQEALRERQVHAIVQVGAGFQSALSQGETARITIRYNSVRPLSQEASERVEQHLKTYRAEMLADRLKQRDLNEAWIKPVSIQQDDTAPQERRVGSLLAQFLPMVILVFMVTGAFYPAIDLTAGEKERKTIQTLLTSPVRPLEIVTGKYLVVFSMAMFAGLINLLSIGLVLYQSASMGAAEAFELDVQVSAADVGALTLVIVLFGLMLSAVLMTIASMASSPKDAQTYMSPVYMLCLLPVTLAGIPGVALNEATAFIPVLNLALVMKEILIEGAQLESLFLVGLSTLLITMLTLLLTARIYNRQELLIQPSTVQGFFSLMSASGDRRTPTPDSALAVVGALFLLLYYAGTAVQAQHLLGGLVVTLFGLLLLPTLVYLRASGLDLRASLHLRRPNWRVMLGALLVGLTTFIWLSSFTQMFHDTFLPMPEPFIEAMQELIQMPDDLGGKLLFILVMAVSPAICEEAVFRGMLLSSFRGRTGALIAVLVTALLFGLFHMSLYRLLGTMTLGLIMGYAVWRSGSIWPAVLLHALNNAGALLVNDLAAALGLAEDASGFPIGVLVGSLVVTSLGLALIATSPEWSEDDHDKKQNKPTQTIA